MTNKTLVDILAEDLDEIRESLALGDNLSITPGGFRLLSYGILDCMDSDSREIAELLAARLQDKSCIEDGFGNSVSAWCPKCHQKTMQVVRPGEFWCSECEA